MGELNRNAVAQLPPADGVDLTEFPAADPPSGNYFRAHTIGRGPWFFASAGSGRFDIQKPNGSCYLADRPETAIRESLGVFTATTGCVTSEMAEQKQVSFLALPGGLRAANLSDHLAIRYKVTRELSTMSDYSVPHSWAKAFHSNGFGGVRYSSRFTTEPGPNSWAVFGEDGEDAGRKFGHVRPITGREACEEAGIRVLPPPGRTSVYRVIYPV